MPRRYFIRSSCRRGLRATRCAASFYGLSFPTKTPASFAGGIISIGVAGDYALALDVPAGTPDGRRKWRLSSAADGRLVAEGVLNVAKGAKKAIAPVGGFVNAGDYVLTIERQ